MQDEILRLRLKRIWRHLDERGRRLFAANEALQAGHGGISRVSRICGLSRVTITKGVHEIDHEPLPIGRIRRPGAGRPKHPVRDPALLVSLEALVEPLARGDPESPLRWTCKSTRVLARELTRQNHPISHTKVGQLLRDMNDSLQSNRKRRKAVIILTATRNSDTSMIR